MGNLTDDERIALLTEMSQVRFALLCCSFCALPAFGLLILRPTESTHAYPVGTKVRPTDVPLHHSGTELSAAGGRMNGFPYARMSGCCWRRYGTTADHRLYHIGPTTD